MAALQMISPVKRDRQRKQAKMQLKINMRQALPVLNKDEIRRFRLTYYEAILLELNEQGYTCSAEFLQQLMDYQEELRQENGPESLVAARPLLMHSKEQFDRLYIGLKNAEDAHYRDDTETECNELITLAALFGFGSVNWWWLGEQLLMQANDVSSKYRKDGGKKTATCKYIYGKFHLEKLEDIYEAKELLIDARHLSLGQLWNAKRELGPEQRTIFIESCILLYKALLQEAKDVMELDPLKASRICAIARKRALDACDHPGEAEALILQGICEMLAGEAHEAVTSFSKVLQLYTKLHNILGICEVRIHLSLAHLKVDNKEEARLQLEVLAEFAQEHHLPLYLAQAYRFLGENYLKQDLPHEATPLLIKALNIFHELEDFPNREQARNLAAISAGQELLPRWIDLILKCGRPGSKGLKGVNRMMRWKDIRELFWDDQEDVRPGRSESLLSEFHIEDIVYGEMEGLEEGYLDDVPSDALRVLEPKMDSVEVLHYNEVKESVSDVT